MKTKTNVGTILDNKLKEDILKEVSRLLNEFYVFEDKAKEIEAKLNENFNKGLFKKIFKLQTFAEEIDKILRKIAQDKHLKIYYSDSDLNRLIKMRESTKKEIRKIRQKHLDRMKEINFGFKKLEILDGNIGYLELIGFACKADVSKLVECAMRFLANTKSIIIDLRNNEGGEPETVLFLASYFLEAGILWNTIHWPFANSKEELWIFDKVLGKKMLEKELYILTSKDTFSAGEDFAYGMKQLKRATIIGETTKGGAHPTDGFSVLDLLVLNIPKGRSINPITETNWEGVGVKPDLSLDAKLAFDKAYELAIK